MRIVKFELQRRPTLMAVLDRNGISVNSQEMLFFKSLGARITQARKERGLTQQQLAEQLGIVQQTYAHYEAGDVRFPASTLPILGQILGLTPEELLGQEQPKAKRGPTPKLQQQIDRIRELPKAKQQAVIEVLDMVLASQSGH
jgi:transcriptional regulator with XRE-family HTH domain